MSIVSVMPSAEAMEDVAAAADAIHSMEADVQETVVAKNAVDDVEETIEPCARTHAPVEGVRATHTSQPAQEALGNSSTEVAPVVPNSPSPSNSSELSNSSTNSSSKKKRAVKPKNPGAAPKSYPQAILHVVWKEGLLSRAGLANACKELGFDKATCIKPALSKCLKEGLITIDASWYSLGESLRGDDEYTKRLEAGLQKREEMHLDKEASRKRADAQYKKNLKEAGGLTVKAQSDLAWAAGHANVRAAAEGLICM